MKIIKAVFTGILVFFGVICPVGAAATFTGGLLVGIFGAVVVGLILSLPNAFVLLFYPMNHPKRRAIVKEDRDFHRRNN